MPVCNKRHNKRRFSIFLNKINVVILQQVGNTFLTLKYSINDLRVLDFSNLKNKMLNFACFGMVYA
jgi:ribosomal protein L28